jgi:2-methylcitrate dehydratase PrpD
MGEDYDDRTSAETRTLLDFVSRTPPDEVPAEVLHESIRCLLDHLGLAIAGAAEPAAGIAREQCLVLGGEPQARALGTSDRLRVTDAALVNGIACHALDFDDTHVPTILHPTTPLYGAGTALAEWRRSRGIDLLAAHALGYELAARASNALYPEHYDAGWHMTGTTGALASATVAIRLLGLAGITATHCLSIAATQAAGHREQFGTMTKPFHAGHAAQAGVWAGLLAAGGFTGAPDPLQGRRGMLAVMSSASSPADLVDDLGEKWQIFDNGVKPYACGVVIHPAIDAVRDLAVRKGLTAERIDKIRLGAPAGQSSPERRSANGFGGQVLGDVRVRHRAAGRQGGRGGVLRHGRPPRRCACADGADRGRPRPRGTAHAGRRHRAHRRRRDGGNLGRSRTRHPG